MFVLIGITRAKITFVLGQPERALNCFYTALDMQLRIHRFNRDVDDVQDTMLCVAILHHQLANFREAMELYTQVHDYRRKRLGDAHPDTRHVFELRLQVF